MQAKSANARLFLIAALAITASVVFPKPSYSQIQSQWSQEASQLTMNAVNTIRAGNPSQGLATLQSALAIAPDSYDVNFYTGYALEQMGRLKEAQQWYLKANFLNPSRHEALLGVGRIYYEQNDFKNALPILEQLSINHQDTESTYSSYLALAKCYAETGRFADFQKTMNLALSYKARDPSAWKFAGQEMDYLKQYDLAIKYYGEYLKRFPNYADSAWVTQRLDVLAFEKEQAEELKEVSHGFSLRADNDDLASFLTFLSPDHKDLSDKAIAQVLLGLSQIPRTYRHQLEQAGYKVVLAPTVLAAMPELETKKPRGYQDGADWHNINGTFDRSTKRIIIGEQAHSLADGNKMKEGPLDETVQHEFGHAYDSYLGLSSKEQNTGDSNPEISHSKAFSAAYEKDLEKLPESLKSKLAYYLQSGNAGKEELFAEMFVLFFGHQPEPGSPQESFKTAFPSVLQLLEDARKSDPDYARLHALYDSKLKENTLTPEERARELSQ